MTAPKTIRLYALSCLTALALIAPGCGDDDSDSKPSGAAATADKATTAGETKDGQVVTNQRAAEQPATDEAQIKALLAQAQRGFKTGDGQAVCDGLTKVGQRDLVAYGSVMGIAGRCPDVVKGIARNNRTVGLKQPPSRVISVRVNGQRAVALVRIPGTGPLRQRYQKVDGQWKVTTYDLADAVGVPDSQR